MKLLDIKGIKEAILANVLSEPNIESCGLIVFDGKKYSVIKCHNAAKDKKRNFYIDRLEIKEKVGDQEKVGFYHSHDDNCQLGPQDISVMHKLKLNSIIVNAKTQEMNEFEPDENYIPPYTQRPFIAGYLDCSELVKDYYKRTLNIELSVLDHPIKHMSWLEIKNNWEQLQYLNSKDNNFLLEYFINNGFREINIKELKKHDIIICKSREIEAPIHCMIYLPGDNVLHHPSERLSTIEPYSDFYKKLTVFCVRHSSN